MSNKEKTLLVPKLRFPEFRDAAAWQNKELGSVCEILNNRRRPITGSDREPGPYPYYGASGIVDFVKEFIFDERLLLVGEDGAKWNAFEKTAFIVEGKYWVNNHAHVLKPIAIRDTLLENYLTMVDLGPFVTGAAPPKLTLGKLKSIPVPVPPSTFEQQKIADCLSSLDELIAAQARKVDTLKTHKKGLMQQLFPREGETQPRLRFPEFWDAGDWQENTLDEIATFRRGSFPQPYGLPEWYDEQNGMPFIQVFDVGGDFRLKDKTKSRISKLGAEKSVFIPEGTLIVTLQGSIGRVAITHYDAYIDRTLLIFESFQKPIEKVFFARVIQNLFDIEKEKAPGGIIKTITKESLSDFKVKYSAVEEQQRIADCLTSLDTLVTAATQELEGLKTHKKGLMQQLFPSVEEGN